MIDRFNDAEHLRLVIFMLARNSKVLPKGIKLGKSLDEIEKMSYMTMLSLIDSDIISWERAKKSYYKGKKLYEEGKA